MDLRQLAALVAIADHGSFSAAARSLHTVQSNVSTHVARLERELDTTLVDRANGELTVEGEAVVARARRVQGELDALVADVTALHHEVTGTVRRDGPQVWIEGKSVQQTTAQKEAPVEVPVTLVVSGTIPTAPSISSCPVCGFVRRSCTAFPSATPSIPFMRRMQRG